MRTSRFLKIAVLSLTAFLVIGCGREQEVAARTDEQIAAEETAALAYFSTFFYNKSALEEDLLSTKTADSFSKLVSLHNVLVPFEGDLRLNADKTFVFNFKPAAVAVEESLREQGKLPSERRELGYGPAEVKGTWKIQGSNLILGQLGKLEQAQQGDTSAAKIIFSQVLGHFDLSVCMVLLTPEKRRLPVALPATDPYKPLTAYQIEKLAAWFMHADGTVDTLGNTIDRFLTHISPFYYGSAKQLFRSVVTARPKEETVEASDP